MLILVLGLRKGEVLGLSWPDIDLDTAELTIGRQLQRVRGQLLHRETKTPASAATALLIEATRENGLLVGKGGLYGNVMRVTPPMNIGRADVDNFIQLLDKSLTAVAAATSAVGGVR